MTVLLLGSTGLLGQALAAEARARGLSLLTAARRGADLDLDIADLPRLGEALATVAPAAVINAAAMVDVATSDASPGVAYAVNAAPVALLAEWAKGEGRRLVHVSTDHFFIEGGARPHGEDETVALLNQYAATKYAAEAFALTAPSALVLRTSIVGLRRRGAPTFAEWAIGVVTEDRPVTLFADAWTSSIDVGACARATFDLFDHGAAGRLNLGAREVYSKAAFIHALAAAFGRPLTRAATGSVADLHPPRPASLGLDVTRAQALLDWRLPDLAAVIEAVLASHRSPARL